VSVEDSSSFEGLTYEQTHLVKMANQIAANIPGRDDIPEQLVAHVRSFWTPAMLADLEFLTREQPDIFDADVRVAAELLREGASA
jgi:hypothetical protein